MSVEREATAAQEERAPTGPRAGIRIVRTPADDELLNLESPYAYLDNDQEFQSSRDPQGPSVEVRAMLFDALHIGLDGVVTILEGARSVAQNHIGPALMSLAKGLILRVEGPVFGAHKIDTKQCDIPQRRKDREK